MNIKTYNAMKNNFKLFLFLIIATLFTSCLTTKTNVGSYKESEGVEEVLDEIGEVYKDFIVERSPIELVNYHENCPI